MKSRRDEIEEKRARIAEIKRQREEKRLRQSGAGLGGSVSASLYLYCVLFSANNNTEIVLATYIGEWK